MSLMPNNTPIGKHCRRCFQNAFHKYMNIKCYVATGKYDIYFNKLSDVVMHNIRYDTIRYISLYSSI